MRRAARPLALALLALGLGAGAVLSVLMLAADSPLMAAADGALVLVDAAAMTALSVLVWPRGAP